MIDTFNDRQLLLISGAAVGLFCILGFAERERRERRENVALLILGPYTIWSYRGMRARRLRLLGGAFVRPIMNSVSFVEGGSFLLAPSKLRSLHHG